MTAEDTAGVILIPQSREKDLTHSLLDHPE
jgi:hypothetical protein